MNKINILDFQNYKYTNHKISMVTAYDYTSASIINHTSIDSILVGDSAAILMSGDDNTLSIDSDILAYHTSSVSRGAPDKFIIADMPFLSYRKNLMTAMDTVEKLIRAGANSIKLEGVTGHESIIKHITQSGIPVMGHIGLTPQYINQLGGYKIQGKEEKQQQELISQAKKLEDLGCYSIVLECMPSILAKEITSTIKIPTIGIGAGNYVDGQVLVWHDLLGLTDYKNFNKKPRFVKEYLNTRELFTDSLNKYHQEIQEDIYPEEEHSY